MKKKLTFLFCLPFSILFAQSSDHHIVAPQGGTSKGETIMVTWTMGDLVTQEAALADARITQGFQQPTLTVRELDASQHEGYVPKDHKPEAGITSRSSTDFSAQVYPNPVGAELTVKVDNSTKEYYLDIFDQAGNLISRNKSTNPQEVLNLSQLPAAQYVLKISLIGSNETKIFQIVKTQ